MIDLIQIDIGYFVAIVIVWNDLAGSYRVYTAADSVAFFRHCSWLFTRVFPPRYSLCWTDRLNGGYHVARKDAKHFSLFEHSVRSRDDSDEVVCIHGCEQRYCCSRSIASPDA